MLAACEEIIKSFNPVVATIDAHSLEHLGDVDAKGADPDKVFMKQVFYGCVRYKKPLKVFLLNFYHDNAGTTLRSDYTMYMVLAYLAIFRLKELGFDHFRPFIMSQEPSKMHVFLTYLWDEKNIYGPIRNEWLTLFDADYIENELTGTMEKFRGDVMSLCNVMHAKAFGIAAAKEAKEADAGVLQFDRKKQTVPRSPRLTRPKPRKVPEPIKIEQTSLAKKVPKAHYTNNLSNIEQTNMTRRKEEFESTNAKYKPKEEFSFHETRSNIENVRAEVEARREAELQFDSFRAKPMPVYPDEGAHVRLNVASVLREDFLYKQKQEQESAMIKAYEEDLRDANEFYRWQTEMKGKDVAMRKTEVERRRLEMVQSAKDAIEAQRRQKRENKEVADKIKEEAVAMGNQRDAEEELVLLMNQQLVEEVREIRETAPALARKKLKKANEARRKKQDEEVAARAAKKAEEDRKYREEMMDKVRQIQALERVLQKAETGAEKFDPTTTMGQGLLEELSLVELKERLAMARVAADEKEKDRRREILQRKQDRAVDIRTRIENTGRIRQAAHKSNHDARARRKKKAEEARKADVEERNQGNLRLASKLEAKRKSQQKDADELVAEEQRIATQRMFLGAAKSMIEEKHFEEQLMGAEREAKIRQESAKAGAKVYEATKKGENDMRVTLNKRSRATTKDFHSKQSSALERARHELTQKNHETLEDKKTAFRKERGIANELKTQLITRNPYANDQTKKVKERGRMHATKTMGRSTMGGSKAYNNPEDSFLRDMM